MAVDPYGRYLYVVNRDDETVSQLEIRLDGTLASLSPPTAAAGADPTAICVHPSGRFVYVANGDNTLSLYGIEGRAPGALVPHPERRQIAVPGAGLSQLGVDASGRYLYALNRASNDVAQFAVSQSGNLTPLTPPRFGLPGKPGRMALNPHGTSLFVMLPTDQRLLHLEISGDGGIYVPNEPALPLPSGATDLGVHPGGRSVSVTAPGDFDGMIFHYLLVNGQLKESLTIPSTTVSNPSRIYFPREFGAQTVVLGKLVMAVHSDTHAWSANGERIPVVGDAIGGKPVDPDQNEVVTVFVPEIP
jgi:DNA-binding beta-propeller fold protein YncE